MKILLISDTHGNNEAIDLLSKKYPNMDFYILLGDSESDEFSIRPFVCVQGNNDFYPYFQKYLLIPTPQGYIYASHKPPFLSEIHSINPDIKIVLHGHTHKRRFEKIGNIVYINPGAISYSRDGNDLSYSILEITESDLKNQFYTL